jgi:hypothetical protein
MKNDQTTILTKTVDVAKIQAEAAAKATEDCHVRLKAITTAAEGKKLPSLVAHLAFDTNLSIDIAIGIMKAVLPDVGTAKAEAEPVKSFEQQKTEDGALGLASFSELPGNDHFDVDGYEGVLQ